MKRKIIVPVVLLFSLVSLKAQKVDVIVNKKNQYGILIDGHELIKPKYKYISPLLDNNFFIFQGDQGFGVLDISGKEIIPPTYEAMDYFGNKTFQAKYKGKWGLVNSYNYASVPFKYSKFNRVSDDLFEIWDGSKVGYVSQYGVIIIEPKYDSIQQLGPSTYLVSEKGKYGIISNLGETIVAPSFDSITQSADPKYYDIKVGNKIGKMNTAFQVVIKPEYDSIESSNLGMTLTKNNKIGFYTSAGKLIPAEYTKVVFFQPEFGLAVVKGDNNLLGFVKSNGLIVSPRYDNISRFSGDGTAFVEKAGKLMAVKVDGNEITVQEVMNNSQGASQAPLPAGQVYPF